MSSVKFNLYVQIYPKNRYFMNQVKVVCKDSFFFTIVFSIIFCAFAYSYMFIHVQVNCICNILTLNLFYWSH